MRKAQSVALLFVCAVLLIAVSVPALASPAATSMAIAPGGNSVDAASVPIFGPGVEDSLAALAPTGQTSVIVTLKDQVNPRSIGGKTRHERLKNVESTLQQKANATQTKLLRRLRQYQKTGEVSALHPMWITNAIAITATADVIREMAQQPEVRQITTDATISIPAGYKTAASPTIAANLSLFNAPALWNMGFQGQGIVVASMDTGVDTSNPDLAATWRGGSDSWYDPYGQHATPADLSGHGTWTMGVMVGGSSSGTSTGVAPQAKWIAAKIFNDRGTATTSAIHQAYQWLLDPDGNPNTADAPNVVNNSWTYSNVNGCDTTFEQDLANLTAAGIVSVFAAGNYGPNAATSVSPANNPDAFAVGGVDNTDAIDTNSSQGPTTCGSSRTYPDVVAPDVGIPTTDLGGLYTTATGTSMAAPQVAGGLALLLNAFPQLTPAQQRIALTSSAHDLGAPGPDNTFGAGQIDLLAAYNLIASGALPTPTPTPPPTPTPTATPSPTATNTPTPPPTPTATPTPPNTIFADGFESGNTNAWSATGGTAGRLSVTAAAAQSGAYGLQTSISGGTSGYVQDTTPAAEISYHARFYLNPNSASVTTTARTIFSGLDSAGKTLFRVQIRRQSGGAYQIAAAVVTSSGTTTTTSWYTISGTTFGAVEIAWQAGAQASFSLYTGGTLRQTLTGLNTGGQTLETVRLGPQGSLGTASGTLYFDNFVSTRTTVIGL